MAQSIHNGVSKVLIDHVVITVGDQLEATAARSLLRPLALLPDSYGMTEPEWEALWELASNRRGRLGYRFVEEATRSPGPIRQLRDRAGLALPGRNLLSITISKFTRWPC